MKEIGIYKLKDSVIDNLQNLPFESYDNTWAHSCVMGISGMRMHSNNGGTAEESSFVLIVKDEGAFFTR